MCQITYIFGCRRVGALSLTGSPWKPVSWDVLFGYALSTQFSYYGVLWWNVAIEVILLVDAYLLKRVAVDSLAYTLRLKRTLVVKDCSKWGRFFVRFFRLPVFRKIYDMCESNMLYTVSAPVPQFWARCRDFQFSENGEKYIGQRKALLKMALSMDARGGRRRVNLCVWQGKQGTDSSMKNAFLNTDLGTW